MPSHSRTCGRLGAQGAYEYHPVSTFFDLEALRQLHPLVELHEHLAATDGKVDVLFMTCKQQFKLAKDFLVISQSKSMLGGLFSSTQIKIKKMDAGLKDRDLQFVSSYFSLLAYQQVAIAEGLPAPPDPSFPQSEEELLLQNWDNYAEEQREKRL